VSFEFPSALKRAAAGNAIRFKERRSPMLGPLHAGIERIDEASDDDANQNGGDDVEGDTHLQHSAIPGAWCRLDQDAGFIAIAVGAYLSSQHRTSL
jgi:hypothetical protein